jgi:hypothetical protein
VATVGVCGPLDERGYAAAACHLAYLASVAYSEPRTRRSLLDHPLISAAPMPLAADSLRRIRVPAYLIFAVTSIFPLIDLILTVLPFHPGTVMWRFGTVGLLSSAIGAPLLVLVLIYAVALWAGDRPGVITVSVLAALICVVLLIGAGSFTLDALQMKGQVNPQAMDKFKVASAMALLKLVVLGLSAAVLAISAWRSSRGAKRVVARAGRPNAGLVVGQGAAPAPTRGTTDRVEPPVVTTPGMERKPARPEPSV